MTPAAFANLLAYALQIALLIAVCAGVPRLLRVRSPGALFVFWRAVAASCLLLPFVQPWKHVGLVTATPLAIRVADQGTLGPGPAATISTLSAVWDPFVLRAVELVVVLGIVTHLVWLAAGLLRLRQLRRRTASAPTTAEFDDLQATIGTHATIRWTDAIPFPVTFGWRRPIVLLPSKVRRLETAAARAVVAHELFHVSRRDWPWQIAEEVLRAIFWFHPAMWWLISRLQLARETVVDELSILATNARRAYMDALLAFADESLLSPASAFSRRRHLFHRIVLLSREGSMSAARLASASLVLCAALAGSAAVAVAAFPLVQPPRDPVPGQLSSEQRAVLERNVDRSREALVREPAAPDLHHRLATALWARTVKDPEMTDAERVSALREAVAEEDAALRVRPDYLDALRFKSMLLGAVAARTGDPAERGRALADASRVDAQVSAADQGTSSGDLFAAEVAQLHALKVGSGIRPPTRIHDVHPEYPAEAKAAGVQGVVVIECLIDTTGRVASTRVERSVPALDAAALDAVRQWEYQPVLLNGAPVPVLMTVTVNFTLQ